MLISEKQIMQLLYVANELRTFLIEYKSKGTISETGQTLLEETSALITAINNQQSEELKAIE